MESERVWTMFFSPTGTTEKVVTKIGVTLSNVMCKPMKKINFTLPRERENEYAFTRQDLVIFGVPVIAGRVPNVLLKFLETIKGNGALVVPIVVYGNRNYDDALKELRNILKIDGFITIAGGAFIGEHSFSNALAEGRPDEVDLNFAEEFARTIGLKLQTLNEVAVTLADEERSLKEYYKPRDRYGNFIDIRKVKPKTNGNCNNCGVCVKVCPMGSINVANAKEVTGICIKCGACIKKCPRSAKYYDDSNYLYHKTELEQLFTRKLEPKVFLKL